VVAVTDVGPEREGGGAGGGVTTAGGGPQRGGEVPLSTC
jgi:hypothetical protein